MDFFLNKLSCVYFLHIDHFKIAGLLSLSNNCGIYYWCMLCICFKCHFSFQEILCRMEEELEDDKVVKILKNRSIFHPFSLF